MLENDSLFIHAFKHAPIGMALVLPDGRWFKVNPSLCNMTGYSEDELLNRTFQSITHPDDLQLDLNFVKQVLDGDSDSYQMEKRYLHKLGNEIWVQLCVSLVRDQQRIPLFFTCQIVDITEQKQMDKKLKESEERYRRLVEFSPVPIFVHSEGKLIYGNPAWVTAIGAQKKEAVIGKPIIDFVHPDFFATANSRAIEAEKHGDLPPIEYQLIRLDGQVRDFELSTIAMSYGNKLVFQVVAKDITDRKQMERELRRSKEHLQNIFDSLDVAIWSSDMQNNTLFCSAGIEKISGRSAQSFMENTTFWRTIIYPEDLAIIEQAHKERMTGKSTITNYRLIHPSGDIKWIEDRVVPVCNDDGMILRFDSLMIDITNTKKVEQALVESETKYRLMAESMNDFIAIVRRDGTLAYASPSHTKLLGYQQWEKGSILQHIHQDDRARVQNAFEKVLSTLCGWKVEFRFIHKNGNMILVESHGTPVVGIDGEVESIIVVHRDISDRKRAEEKLKKTKQQLETILNSVDAGIWSLDLGENKIYLSQGIEKITGYEPGRFDDNPMRWMEIVYEEDRPIIEQFNQELRSGKKSKHEYRIRDHFGNIRWFIHHGYPVFDSNDDLVGLTGVTMDITSRKDAEIALQESEERYRLLQTSLDHFSKDLIGVMKLNQLEHRLVKEVEKVIRTDYVGILEVNNKFRIKQGRVNIPLNQLDEISLDLMIGELVMIEHGVLIKIGENKGTANFIWVGDRTKIENLYPKKVWLETIIRYVSVWYDNLHQIEDLTKELEMLINQNQTPPWLLRLFFQLSEKVRKRLSMDLHDSALQEQIIWYRKMDQLCSSAAISEDIQKELKKIHEGMADVIYQIRLTCNELRPSFLNDAGIVNALEGLFTQAQLRSDYSVDFNATSYETTLNQEQTLAIYRVVQELLNNTTKHSNATEVEIILSNTEEQLELRYTDNGVGFTDKNKETDHMGLYGIRERVRSLEGNISFHFCKEQGLEVRISIPLIQQQMKINMERIIH